MASFTGFYPETFGFFAGLVHNNEKSWFEAHRADYERYVVEPALALITDLDSVVRSISPRYRGVAKRQGGSLMRLYRDVRFSRDKTPYKTNVGIQFRHDLGKDVHAPGWYVHLDLQECFVGAGSWHPEPEDLLSIRSALLTKGAGYQAALATAAQEGLIPVGDVARRVPRGFEADHPLAAEFRRKDFLVSANLDPNLYLGPELVEVLAAKFRASATYMAWLCESVGAPFS